MTQTSMSPNTAGLPSPPLSPSQKPARATSQTPAPATSSTPPQSPSHTPDVAPLASSAPPPTATEAPPPPPDPSTTEVAEAGRARIAASLIFAVHGAVGGGFASRLPWLQDHLDLSPGQLGLALAAPAVGASLAMPLAASLVHRHGGRTALRCLIALWCAVPLLPASAPGLPWLCAALLVFGVGAGMSDVAMNTQGLVVERRLGRSTLPLLHGMWSAGALIGAGLGAAAAFAGLDARVHLAILALLLASAGWFAGHNLLDARPTAGAKAPPRFALPSRPVLVIGAVGFCAIFAEGAGMNWSAVHLREVADASPGVAALAYTGFACTMAIARLASGTVVDRFGVTRTVRAGAVAATIGAILVATAHSPLPAALGFALLGVGVSAVLPLTFAAAGRIGDDPSQSIAGVATVTYTSGLIAPALVGGIADRASLSASFAVVAVLTAILIPAARMLGPTTAPRGTDTGPAGPGDAPSAPGNVPPALVGTSTSGAVTAVSPLPTDGR
ncbi:MFS transporter (plasmid) [Embleya sp. NBC_00888]|uniref:MFS transporter n=1 Tax=Embleya sp. NBC_00888 TaxID=2975960 RepID=UPI002F914E0D|nr:MFS transporter [Embleya sp. NBC_00888]